MLEVVKAEMKVESLERRLKKARGRLLKTLLRHRLAEAKAELEALTA